MQELLGSVTKAPLPATRGISKEAVQHGVIVVSYTCLIVGTGSQAEVQNPLLLTFSVRVVEERQGVKVLIECPTIAYSLVGIQVASTDDSG